MKFKLRIFHETIVLRTPRPYWDVLVVKDVNWALVSEERFQPPREPNIKTGFYESWPYGPDWRLAYVPGVQGLFCIYEPHVKNSSRKV